jgi:hypothetical protein
MRHHALAFGSYCDQSLNFAVESIELSLSRGSLLGQSLEGFAGLGGFTLDPVQLSVRFLEVMTDTSQDRYSLQLASRDFELIGNQLALRLEIGQRALR